MTEPNEAGRFFEALAADLDTSSPLRWSFVLGGLSEDQVEPLKAEVGRLGFTEVEGLFDEDHSGRYNIWFAEVCTHSKESFAERVEAVDDLAEREGLKLSDDSAATPGFA
jgi:hypothetical protein